MDILTYIDRVKANYSKQPEPRYNTRKYFTGGLVTTPKRGFVDGPGSYAGNLAEVITQILETQTEFKNRAELLAKVKEYPGFENTSIRSLAPYKIPILDKVKYESVVPITEESLLDFFGKEELSKLRKEGFSENNIRNRVSSGRGYDNLSEEQKKIRSLRNTIDKKIREELFLKNNLKFVNDIKKNVYRTEKGKFIRRHEPLIPITEIYEKYKLSNSTGKEYSSAVKKLLGKDGILGIAEESDVKRQENIKKGIADAGPTVKPGQKNLRDMISINNKKYINLLEKDPKELIKTIRQKNNLMDQLESVFKDGEVQKEKIKITNDEIKKLVKSGLYSEDHKTQVQTGSKNIEYNVNKSFVTKRANSKVLVPMTAWLNKNWKKEEGKIKDPKIKNIKNWLTKNNINIKVEGVELYFGDDSLKSIPAVDAYKKQLNFLEQNRKRIEAVGCYETPAKAMGGRIGFAGGTDCFNKGVKAINSGKIAKGAQARNFAKFANSAYKLGRGVMKFGVIPEALFVGAESLIRMNMGDTLDEALYRATDWLIPGNQTDYADVLKIERTLGGEAAEVFRNVTKWRRKNEELQSLEQAEQADLALAGTDFAETNSGVSADETRKTYAGLKDKKRKEVLDASVSKDDQVLSQSSADEAYDISEAKSKSNKAKSLVVEDESGLNIDLLSPERNQENLNTRMSPKNFRKDMEYSDDDVLNAINSNIKKGFYKNREEAVNHYNQTLYTLKKFKEKPLSSYVLEDRYTPEEIYGTQGGEGFLNKINREKFIRPGTYKATSEEQSDIYDMGRQGAATGGIASLTKTVAPKKGPQSQGQSEGLAYFMKHGKK